MAANINANFDEAFNHVDWVELYNESSNTINLYGYSLTDDPADPEKYQIWSNIPIYPGNYRIISLDKRMNASGIHANFSLNVDGEFLGLYDYSGNVVDTITFGKQARNISCGRLVSDPDSWGYFIEPTPNASNNETYLMHSQTAGDVQFSVTPGFYSGSVTVEITTTGDVDQVRYTLNGDYPNSSSTIYSGPIIISESKVIRAECFATDRHPGQVSSSTYFIDIPTPNMPVVSLSTDIENFEDYMIGIYVDGANGITDPNISPDIPVNWLQDWERPINFEFFSKEGEQQISQLVGTNIFGNISQSFPIKSLTLISRKDYGKKGLDHQFFEDKEVDEFKSLILRNSGNDATSTFLRDGFMQTIVKDRMDIDNQAYQPVLVYLNGEYFGLLNLREKMNEHYAASNYGVEPDSIDVIMQSLTATNGNKEAYDALIAYLHNNDLSEQAAFDHVASLLDVDEYLNYFMLNIYYGNHDWPYYNTKLWRERKDGAKWRALLYDTDQSFGLNLSTPNTLLWALQDHYSTLIFRSLLQNETCSNEFFQRFAAHINTTWQPDRILPVLDSLKNLIASHIPYQIANWYMPLSALKWDQNVNVIMPEFANTQIEVAQGWIKSYLGISSMHKLNVTNATPGRGNVKVCEVDVPNDYSGDHFDGLPIRLEAIPKPGYIFAGWTGDYTSSDVEIWVDFNSVTSVAASFIPSIPIDGLYINEFMASNSNSGVDEYNENEDWIEIYNSNNQPVDIAGLYISDSLGFLTQSMIPFGEPENTTIPANGYKILWADNDPQQGILHLCHTKLNKSGEMIILSQQVDDEIQIMDSITYTKQYSDVTYGRDPNESEFWKFLDPTPEAENHEKILENIFINEFIASNRTVLQDEDGKWDDWIELYNANDYPVNISGMFLSDDFENPTKFRIPNTSSDSTTIPARGYLLLWADDSTEQGICHLNFKLSGSGEQILIGQPNGVDIIDTISYPNLIGDAPYGRTIDGSGHFSYLLATPGASNTQPSFQDLFINEFMASNRTVLEDRPGEFDDWIELYNNNDYPVNVGGLFLSDDIDNKVLFRISTAHPVSTTIPAKGHMLIWADDSTEQGILHAGFKLSGSGEQIILASTTGKEIIDSITYGDLFSDAPYGRISDGNPVFGYLTPTPWAPNSYENIDNIFINEVLAANSQTNADEYGDIDDWIELYNGNNHEVNIGGMFITDQYGVDLGYRIPKTDAEQTTIPAYGYLLIWADDSTEQGILHANFKLNRGGEQIVLVKYNGLTVADSLSFGSQQQDISIGRISDGAVGISKQIPTPGAANKTFNYEGIILSEVMASDHTGFADDHGEYEDWIELYNSSASPINIAGMVLSDSIGRPDRYLIPGGNPELTTIQPDDYLVLWADDSTEQGVLHIGFGLSESGEQVGIFTTDGRLLDSVTYPNQYNNFSYSKLDPGVWMHVPPTPGEMNVVETFENLYINEYMADNENRFMDEFEEYDDWIEIYNDNTYPVNLAGLYLSDSLPEANMYRISSNDLENTEVSAKGHAVIWTDSDSDQGALHTNFKLSRSGEDLVLSGYDYRQTIDSRSFEKQYSNFATGRLNDQGPWVDMPPTPGATNVMPDLSRLFINEIMTSNLNAIADNYGEFDDWIEFYNGGQDAIDLGGLFISDTISATNLFRISSDHPDSTTIQPYDYLLIWADDSVEQGVQHTNFKLSRSGEQVAIYDYNREAIIDSATYTIVPVNKTYGRYNDGNLPWKELRLPTPLKSNRTMGLIETQFGMKNINYELYPNPVSEEVVISMWIDHPTEVFVKIFDRTGNLVAIPVNRFFSKGDYKITWDLKNSNGTRLETGIYFYVIETDQMFVQDKLLIINNY